MFGQAPAYLIVDRAARVASKAFDSREIGTKTFPGQLPEDARPIRKRCRHRAGAGGQIRARPADVKQLDAPHCLDAASVPAIGQGTQVYATAVPPGQTRT